MMRRTVFLATTLALLGCSRAGMSPPCDCPETENPSSCQPDAGPIDTLPDTLAVDAGLCAEGYEQVVYHPRDAVFCQPVPDAGTAENPCVGSYIESWWADGLVRCHVNQ